MYTAPKETRFIGKKLIYIPDCSSTNSEALRFTDEQGIHDGMVIICRHQFAGRGQAGNKWISEPGKNLTFSVVLDSPVKIEQQFYLNIAVSLGLAHSLQKLLTHKIQVKWPNDLLVEGYKIGGILIENVLRGNVIRYSVLGIGLNINQTEFQIPNTASLAGLNGREFDLNDLLSDLLVSIEKHIIRLRNLEFNSLKSEWIEQLYLLGKTHEFKKGNHSFNGVITGIDESGRLEMIVDNDVQRFNFKEISF